MIKFLINRPIAVSVTFLSLVILGLIAMQIIPVSLMPDIDIPQITVKMVCPNTGAREVEEQYVSRIRYSLQQTSHLDDIESTASNGKGSVTLRFKYGTNTTYANLEVNEKIDALMEHMPEGFERPKVIKSKASDIPAFYLNVSLKKTINDGQGRFIELSEFSESVIKRRIEQLPEVALVDISGLVCPELYISPNEQITRQLGISEKEISAALQANNVNIGNIKVKEGVYEYNIRFSSAIVERTDLENILLNVAGKVIRLGDVAEIGVRNRQTQGKIMNNGEQALTMAVIKKADVQMKQLQESFASLLKEIEKDYKRINVELARDQSALLNISINNLKNTLTLGGVLAFLIVFLFLKDKKAPWLIGVTIPVSIIIAILIFFLSGLSINIISLSGLILGVGMMIDNAIIVIDNIDQHRKKKDIDEACIAGTNEIIRPLLSSVLTTCAVFLPLIFLSGLAGELFFDQAIAVTIGLLVSFIVSITLLPVYFRMLHRKAHTAPRLPLSRRGKNAKISLDVFKNIEYLYGKGYDRLMKRRGLFFTGVTIFTLLGIYVLMSSTKEAFPPFEERDGFAHIIWNENISINESELRVLQLMKEANCPVENYSAFIGIQQFILNHIKECDEDETLIYMETSSNDALKTTKDKVTLHLKKAFPKAQIHFESAPNVFSQIFDHEGNLLEINYVSDNRRELIRPEQAQGNAQMLKKIFGLNTESISLQEYLLLSPRQERMTQYGISAGLLYSRLSQALSGYEVATLKSGAGYTPVVLSDKTQSIEQALSSLYIKGRGEVHYPIREFVSLSKGKDYKQIAGGKEGTYVTLIPHVDGSNVGALSKSIKLNHKAEGASFFLSGEYFQNEKLFYELLLVLLISTLLLYFILAAQFESLLQPLIVLLEIPIDIAGALVVLKLGGSSVNIMSMIGIVVMSGIIINDSILKIDTINRLRKEGLPVAEAIHQAGFRRLKPIIMTSITTILALVPFLIGDSIGNVLQRPLALAIIGGMTVGTVISLYFIPMMYQVMEKKNN